MESAELGQDANGPVWVLTLETPTRQLRTVYAFTPQGVEPASEAAAEDIVKRLTEYLTETTPCAAEY